MNKVIVAMICIIVIIGAIFTGIFLFRPKEEAPEGETEIKVAEEEEILDECTEEYEQLQQENMLETNSEEEKISPNCSFTLEKYYEKCGHTTRQYSNIPEELVNKTREQLQESYPDWEIKTFASNEIVLSKKMEGECGEHYVVRDTDGKVTIYQVTENGQEIEFEQTEISTEYLTETDKINMKNGIRVNGKEELNQLIEDFE